MKMRDELESRMWLAHHDQFGLWVDSAIASVRAGLARLPNWDGSTHQLIALIASFAITAITFNATTA
jgi:hypothetical protein